MASNKIIVTVAPTGQVRIVRELGFEPATPDEARQMMGLA